MPSSARQNTQKRRQTYARNIVLKRGALIESRRTTLKRAEKTCPIHGGDTEIERCGKGGYIVSCWSCIQAGAREMPTLMAEFDAKHNITRTPQTGVPKPKCHI